jgi:hypothetical protein
VVNVLVGPSWPEPVLDVLEVLLIKMLAFHRVVDLEDLEGFHHLLRLVAVSLWTEEWRQWNLEIAPDGDESAMSVVEVCFCDGLEGVFVGLAELYLFFVDVVVVLEDAVDDVEVVEGGPFGVGFLVGKGRRALRIHVLLFID